MCNVDDFCWLVDPEVLNDPEQDIGKLSEQAYADSISKIQGLSAIRNPAAKRNELGNIYDSVINAIRKFNSKTGRKEIIMADNLIPIIEFLIIRSGVENIYAELSFIMKTMPSSCANIAPGFMSTTFMLCANVIEELNSDSVLISEIAHANTEGNINKLWELLYDGLNTPKSFLNNIFANIVDKHILNKEDHSNFSHDFINVRDLLKVDVVRGLAAKGIVVRDERVVLRASRDVIAKILYDDAIEVFEKDKVIKTLNDRINSELHEMKDVLTFEMIDPLHRNINIDTTEIEKIVIPLMSKKKPITKQIEALTRVKTLIGIENGSSVLALAFIRSEVKDLVTQTYLFNTFITSDEEAIEPHRMLVDAEASVERMDTVWRYTDLIRKEGWNRNTATKSAYRLISDPANIYGRSADAIRKRVVTKNDGRTISEMVRDFTERVTNDMVGWFPAEKRDEEWEAVYNAAETVIIGPNFVNVLRIFMELTRKSDTPMDEKILKLKNVATLDMFGVGPEYYGGGGEESFGLGLGKHRSMRIISGESSVKTYERAIAIMGVIIEKRICTSHKKLEILHNVVESIVETATCASGKSVERIGDDVISKILAFVIVRSGVTGLNGLKLFIGNFLYGSKMYTEYLVKLDNAIEVIEALDCERLMHGGVRQRRDSRKIADFFN